MKSSSHPCFGPPPAQSYGRIPFIKVRCMFPTAVPHGSCSRQAAAFGFKCRSMCTVTGYEQGSTSSRWLMACDLQ